jgi:alpha-glucosidase
MQWDGSMNAGFSNGNPWLPISDDYQVVNVKAEDAEPRSMLSLYRKLLVLRKQHAALSSGDYVPVAMTGDLLAYIRRTPTERFLVALNLGHAPYGLSLTSLGITGRTVLSTYMDLADDTSTDTITLRADEGVIVALNHA